MTNKSMARFTNKDDIMASLAGMEGDIQTAVMEELKQASMEVRNKLKDSLPSGAGEPSAPGGQPYSQTGELKESIAAKVLPPLLGKPITAVVYVGNKGFYGRMLEFGTSKMAARPWFYPFLLRQDPAMRGAILEGLAKEIERRKKMRGTYIKRGRMDKSMAESLYKRDQAFMESL